MNINEQLKQIFGLNIYELTTADIPALSEQYGIKQKFFRNVIKQANKLKGKGEHRKMKYAETVWTSMFAFVHNKTGETSGAAIHVTIEGETRLYCFAPSNNLPPMYSGIAELGHSMVRVVSDGGVSTRVTGINKGACVNSNDIPDDPLKPMFDEVNRRVLH